MMKIIENNVKCSEVIIYINRKFYLENYKVSF